MNILEARNITKTYDGHTALSDLTLDIPQGSVYGLLGPNGAGKTSFIRIINQITAPDTGEILLNGSPMKRDDIYKRMAKIKREEIFSKESKSIIFQFKYSYSPEQFP